MEGQKNGTPVGTHWVLGSFLAIFLGLLVLRPQVALIAPGAAILSFLALLLISRASRINAPREAESSRDLTGTVLKFARGPPVIKSFGTGSTAVSALHEAVIDSEKTHLKAEWALCPEGLLP